MPFDHVRHNDNIVKVPKLLYCSWKYLFAMAAEAVAQGDFESSADAAFCTRKRDAWTEVNISANLNCVFWKSIIAFPNCNENSRKVSDQSC